MTPEYFKAQATHITSELLSLVKKNISSPEEVEHLTTLIQSINESVGALIKPNFVPLKKMTAEIYVVAPHNPMLNNAEPDINNRFEATYKIAYTTSNNTPLLKLQPIKAAILLGSSNGEFVINKGTPDPNDELKNFTHTCEWNIEEIIEEE